MSLCPYLTAISNFISAKKMKKDNLKHVPLPDMIVDRLYCKRQMQGDSVPGLLLEDGEYASGVGWKGYPGHGAVRCTKLKVLRPKTSGIDKTSSEQNNELDGTCSFDRVWRFVRQHKVSPMDLAICWDMRPTNLNDEPKRTKHIDGSNGSQAPAVFSLISTPKETKSMDKSSNGNLVFLSNSEEHVQEEILNDFSHITNNNLRRSKSACKLVENKNKQIYEDTSKDFYRSTPNMLNINQLKDDKYLKSRAIKAARVKPRAKSEYKMAFKAGVPKCQTVSSKQNIIYINVPVQKNPYSKKSYRIESLAPPFSLQNARQDYPDHLRMATIYQHSYKPMHLRKKSLLQSIFH